MLREEIPAVLYFPGRIRIDDVKCSIIFSRLGVGRACGEGVGRGPRYTAKVKIGMRRKELTQMDLKKFVDRYNDLTSLFLQKFGEEAQDKNICL